MPGCRPLSSEEIARVAASFTGPWALRDRAMFVLGCWTGFRISELLSLTCGDVLRALPKNPSPAGRGQGDGAPTHPSPFKGEARERVLTAGDIAERITVARRHMKLKRQGRSVPVHSEARAALAAWLEVLRVKGLLAAATPVFCSRMRRRRGKADALLPFGELPVQDEGAPETDRKPLTRGQAWQILHAAFVRCGIHGQTGTHSMRKSFARRVHRNARGNVARVQQALGHASLASTTTYLAADQDDVDQAILGED